MRPVVRGNVPQDEHGNDTVFTHYRDARDPLVQRIGDYCSYCEVCLHAGIHVEHVRPKDPNPDLEKDWKNFLLACENCNSIKSDTDVDLEDYLWPDRDNTARAFIYEVDQAPRVAGDLNQTQRDCANKLVELCGLDRTPVHPKYSDRDRRWRKRREAWGAALQLLQCLRKNDSQEVRSSIAHAAIARGFWSVWMEVFSSDVEMRKLLILFFSGTATDCYDAETRPVHRPGGKT